MKTHVNTGLMDEVWEVLDGICPPGGEHSLAELGLVTAVSTDGAVMRALLRVPTALCWTAGRSELLAEVEESIRNVPSLSGVELYAKPSWPAWAVAAPERGMTPFSEDSVDPAPFSAHSACVESAFTGSRRHGWDLEGLQRRFYAIFRSAEDKPHQIRVIIRAQIQQAEKPLEVA